MKMAQFSYIILLISFSGLGLGIIFCFIRLVKGPTLPDRVVAIDTFTNNVIAILALLCIAMDNSVYFDAVLVLSALGFVGTVTMAKYLAMGNKIFEE